MSKSSPRRRQTMTSKTTDPRPAATEAARDVIFNTLSGSDASAFMFVTGETDRILTALHDAGLTIAAAPPSGQVCVDDELIEMARKSLAEEVGYNAPLYRRALLELIVKQAESSR